MTELTLVDTTSAPVTSETPASETTPAKRRGRKPGQIVVPIAPKEVTDEMFVVAWQRSDSIHGVLEALSLEGPVMDRWVRQHSAALRGNGVPLKKFTAVGRPTQRDYSALAALAASLVPQTEEVKS